MKKISHKIITSIFIFFIILLLSISIILAYNVKNYSNIEIDEEKILYEIKCFDSKLMYILKFVNKNESEINWSKIQNQTNILYDYWNTVILDFNYLDIDKQDLTTFGKILDDLTISIKYNDKNNTLNNLAKLYDKLIKYTESINYKYYINILLIKYNFLHASCVVETGNWTLGHEYILKASENAYKLINIVEDNQYLQYNINQVYVAVKEMENLINIKDIDIFYLKYNIALDKLDNL